MKEIRWEWATCWLMIFSIVLQLADGFFSTLPFTDQRWAQMIGIPVLVSLGAAWISAFIAVCKDMKSKKVKA
jgi:hypothetical protein